LERKNSRRGTGPTNSYEGRRSLDWRSRRLGCSGLDTSAVDVKGMIFDGV
jgi:hypothetical protein